MCFVNILLFANLIYCSIIRKDISIKGQSYILTLLLFISAGGFCFLNIVFLTFFARQKIYILTCTRRCMAENDGKERDKFNDFGLEDNEDLFIFCF